MKISDYLTTKETTQVRGQQPEQKTGANFAQTLSEVVAKDPAASAAAVNQTSLSSSLEVSPVGRILAASAQPGPAVRVDKTLDTLDRYRQALADPDMNLKQIAPVVEDLKQAAGDLNQLSQQLPAGHALKSVVDQTAVLAAVEAAKFERGDYI